MVSHMSDNLSRWACRRGFGGGATLPRALRLSRHRCADRRLHRCRWPLVRDRRGVRRPTSDARPLPWHSSRTSWRRPRTRCSPTTGRRPTAGALQRPTGPPGSSRTMPSPRSTCSRTCRGGSPASDVIREVLARRTAQARQAGCGGAGAPLHARCALATAPGPCRCRPASTAASVRPSPQ